MTIRVNLMKKTGHGFSAGLLLLLQTVALIALQAPSARGDNVILLKNQFCSSSSYFLLNRNNQFMLEYTSSGNSYIGVGSSSLPLTGTQIPAGTNFVGDIAFSNYGTAVALSGPSVFSLWELPIGGAFQQLIPTGTNISYSIPGVNDAGQVAIAGRATTQTGLNSVYTYTPGGSVTQLPSNGWASVTNNVAIDPSGRVVLGAAYTINNSNVQINRYTPGSGWANLTPAGSDPPQFQTEVWSANPSGQISYPTTFTVSGSQHSGVDVLNGATSSRILDVTTYNSGGSYVTAFDDQGDFMYTYLSGSKWDTILVPFGGTLQDLASVIPASDVLQGYASMSQNGHVLLIARDTLNNEFDYFSFYQGNLHLLLGNQPNQLDEEQVGNDGNLYFLEQQPSGLYSLFQTVPEPGIGLMAGLLFAGHQVLRRRRNGAPVDQHTLKRP